MATHSFDIDNFLDRMPTEAYNCLDFVKEVWSAWFGTIEAEELDRLCSNAHSGRIESVPLKRFKRLTVPQSPCFAVYQRRRQSPHVGIYLDGSILHLQETGVQFFPANVLQLCFNVRARFYK